MEFRVLGPLEVSAAGQSLPLGGPKQRAILALLVLRANTVVPRERLIDDVWGEEPPAEVDASLRVYVARLRKILAAGNGAAPSLESFRSGYLLRVAPDTIDLNRFESLLTSGEEALAAGRAAEASAKLSEALGLWRGPALVDLAEEDWVQRETMRLEQLRLRALAERIEADLATGRHVEIVAELEALVGSDPSRERFVGQLMLALYRSGRQPEALQAYAETRRALHEGFGLDPTRGLRDLERRILVQDPELDVAIPEAVPQPTSRRRRAAGVSLAVGLVGVLVAGAALLGGSDERTAAPPKPLALSGNSVVAIDPSGAVTGEVALGGRPSGIAVGGGSVWVGNRDDETLLRIDPRTRTVVRTIGLSIVPSGIAVGAGSVWVVSEAGDAVMQVDIGTSDVIAKIELRGTRGNCCKPQIAFARGAVWVSYWRVLARIDPSAQKAVLTPFRELVSIASTANALWAIVGTEGNRLQRLEPLGEPIRLDALGATRDVGTGGIAVTDRAVWLAWEGGGLARIDADTNRVTASLSQGRRIGGVAAGAGALWIVARDGTVVRADPRTGRVVRTISLGVYAPYSHDTIAVGAGALWVTALQR